MMMNNEGDKSPPIKCGYCGWLLDGLLDGFVDASLLQHNCLKHYNEEKHLLHIDDNNVATIIEKDQSTSIQTTNTSEYNEALVNAVYSRPALYDHRIPLKDRTSLKKKALWKEVGNLMGENENLEFVQKRWKQLRDSYVRAKKKDNAYIPSGSSASIKNDKMTFALYNQMKFLDDITGKSPTVTSLPALPADIDECSIQSITNTAEKVPLPQSSSDSISLDSWANTSDPATNNSSSFKSQSSKKRKIKEHDDSSDIEMKRVILSNIEESKKTPDAVDGFLLQIGSRLRALPPRDRAQLEIKILTDIFNLESSLSLH